jgi:Superinfection immunity protein
VDLIASGGNAVAAVPGVILVIGLIAGSIMLYFAPWIIAARRHVPNVGTVAVINVLLGWTFIGWVVALAMACRDRPPAAVPYGQLPPYGYGQLPPAGYGPQAPYSPGPAQGQNTRQWPHRDPGAG